MSGQLVIKYVYLMYFPKWCNTCLCKKKLTKKIGYLSNEVAFNIFANSPLKCYNNVPIWVGQRFSLLMCKGAQCK